MSGGAFPVFRPGGVGTSFHPQGGGLGVEGFDIEQRRSPLHFGEFGPREAVALIVIDDPSLPNQRLWEEIWRQLGIKQ